MKLKVWFAFIFVLIRLFTSSVRCHLMWFILANRIEWKWRCSCRALICYFHSSSSSLLLIDKQWFYSWSHESLLALFFHNIIFILFCFGLLYCWTDIWFCINTHQYFAYQHFEHQLSGYCLDHNQLKCADLIRISFPFESFS